MPNELVDALAQRQPAREVALAAARDASSVAGNDPRQKDALAVALYEAASGRFPQDSADRRSVYVGGYWLVGVSFIGLLLMVLLVQLNGQTSPESVVTLATALVSGVVGGLFGYAKQ